jgi:single-stranded DNA-binding protein
MITMNVSGNICADAIIRNVNGTDMVTFSVASNRRYKSKSGESKGGSNLYKLCYLE